MQSARNDRHVIRQRDELSQQGDLLGTEGNSLFMANPQQAVNVYSIARNCRGHKQLPTISSRSVSTPTRNPFVGHLHPVVSPVGATEDADGTSPSNAWISEKCC